MKKSTDKEFLTKWNLLVPLCQNVEYGKTLKSQKRIREIERNRYEIRERQVKCNLREGRWDVRKREKNRNICDQILDAAL